mgnify:CR=1 FL=1|jgi:hypothetical protein
MKKTTPIAIILAVFIVIGYVLFIMPDEGQPKVEVEEVAFEDTEEGAVEDKDIEKPDLDPVEDHIEEVTDIGEDPSVLPAEDMLDDSGIPLTYNLAVPFTSQAPHANWDLPYQEACEEASAYMTSLYYQGRPAGQVHPDAASAAILEVVAFQEDYFNYYLDTTAEETIQFIDLFYGFEARVVLNPTVEMIKSEISSGRPVILPAAGRELGNPNFTGAGPLYHMLVIKGYTSTQFITNDPGTRNGEDYIYNIDVIMDANGDWNNGNPAEGEKVMIFTAK